MNIKHLLTILATGAALTLGSTITSVQAKDTEIFFTGNQSPPNVLFILDTSGSMSETIPGANGDTRMQVLKGALNGVLSGTYEALNVGIMDFNKYRGGGIDFPVADINADANNVDSDIPAGTTVGQVLKHITASYTPNSLTPVADALYQASSYFLGSRVYNTGERGEPNTWNTANNRYQGGNSLSDNPAAYEGGTWTSNPVSCTNRPSRPRYCKIQERICDSTGQECIWKTIETFDPVVGNDPVDPDGNGNRFRVRCWGPNAGGQNCTSGFDTTPTYKSPIVGQCQKNFIVLLSDGEPTRRSARNKIANRVEPVSGGTTVSDCERLNSFSSQFIRDNGRCLPELTKYMSTVDQAPNIPGMQTITTHTIGFALNQFPQAKRFLELLSDPDHGQGKFYEASTAGALTTTFEDLFKSFTSNETDFTAPAVSIDQDNLLATSEYVYQSTFTPREQPGWEGDITRYRIVDSEFTDPTSMADLLTNQRTVYTYTGATPPVNVDLATGSNQHRVTETNADLSLSLLGLGAGAATTRTNIIRWARGIDSADEDGDGNRIEAHKHMGDPLHTKPALVSYANRDILYATTNDGYLHAFDVSAGQSPFELFAFIPQELLPNLDTLYRNLNTDDKVYGLDGRMSVWQTDTNVTLYFGMRRGGKNYYALDVTNPDTPVLKWVIKGGIPGTDFEELGQSWSTPLLTKVKKAGIADPVLALIFGGGYDVKQDDTTALVRSDDTVGRAVFVVEASNGELLWSAGPDVGSLELKNSIPGDIRSIDLNDNGLTDRLYFGDTGGRVWRIDLDESNVANSSGYQLADFNNGTAENNRRFYYPPSVAFSYDGRLKLMLAIGSGYRAHPLDTEVQDRFYAFEDMNATLGRPLSGTAAPLLITDSDLSDITSNSAGNAGSGGGWYLNLEPNEKVLAESLIFNDNAIFTTYTPQLANSSGNNGNSDDICDKIDGTAQAYSLRLANGDPTLRDKDGNVSRKIGLGSSSIPGAPYVIFNKPVHSGNGNGNGSGGNGIPLGKDKQTADLFVGDQMIDQFTLLTERLFWWGIR